MIYITQGHQKGIGLEVLFKSIISLNLNSNKIILIAFIESIIATLKYLDIQYKIDEELITLNNSLKIKYKQPKFIISETTSCLLYALEYINYDDILFTLPSSKEEFVLDNKIVNGHTEFFRSFYKDSDITMCFQRENTFIALMSDHIALSNVTNYLKEDVYIKKISNILSRFSFKNVYISGINPHSGESGLLGNNESIFKSVLSSLSSSFTKTNFYGPLSGDSIWNSTHTNSLIVYAFHDQALSAFKAVNKYKGINLTIGLPFLRMSVDHGTAFELYGKNCANYLGCLEILRQIKKGL